MSNYINLKKLSEEQIKCLEIIGISTKEDMHYIDESPLTCVPIDFHSAKMYENDNYLFERYNTTCGSGIAIPTSLDNPKESIKINEGEILYDVRTRKSNDIEVYLNNENSSLELIFDYYDKPYKREYLKIGTLTLKFFYSTKYGIENVYEEYSIVPFGIIRNESNPDDYTNEFISASTNFNVDYLMHYLQNFFNNWENIILKGVTEEDKEKNIKTVETFFKFIRIYAEKFFDVYNNSYAELAHYQIEEDNRKRKIRIKDKSLIEY